MSICVQQVCSMSVVYASEVMRPEVCHHNYDVSVTGHNIILGANTLQCTSMCFPVLLYVCMHR